MALFGFLNDEPWMENALCYTDTDFRSESITYKEWQAQHRDNDFFDGHYPYKDEAKGYCLGCPVRFECLTAGIKNEEDGIWGGTTERERRKLIAQAKAIVLMLPAHQVEQLRDGTDPNAA